MDKEKNSKSEMMEDEYIYGIAVVPQDAVQKLLIVTTREQED